MASDVTPYEPAGLGGTRQPPAPTTSTYGILRPAEGRAHFTLTRHAPAADLAHLVERHWVVAWDLRGRAPFRQELLEHPCVNVVFEGDAGAVFGMSTARNGRTLEGAGMAVGTKFRPGGFSGFSLVPMASLVDAPPVALTDAFGAGAHALAADVAARPDVAGKLDVVEAFLRERLPAPDPGAALVREVVADMLATAPGTRVSAIARRHGVSVRTLQRLFRRHVGVGPKWVLQRYRLHLAAERIAAEEVDGWAGLAVELGYADQPHFIRDFTRLVGISPAQYAASCRAA